MKNKSTALIFVLSLLTFSSCNNDKKILRLLKSERKDDVILGAYKAGESGSKQFVQLLLKDANDVRTSTNVKFLGYNVYQEKMIALRKIFKEEPPVKITDKPDSVIIKFYTELSKKYQ